MQPLPQVHLHAHVVVDVEDDRVEALVVVMVRIALVVWGHEAIGAHLRHERKVIRRFFR